MNPIVTLTDEQVLVGLRLVSAGREEFVLDESGCSYFDDHGAPLCLIGHLLARHGVGWGDMPVYNNDNVLLLVEKGLVACSQPAAEAMAVAQQVQDQGLPWGEAVAMAVETYHDTVEILS